MSRGCDPESPRRARGNRRAVHPRRHGWRDGLRSDLSRQVADHLFRLHLLPRRLSGRALQAQPRSREARIGRRRGAGDFHHRRPPTGYAADPGGVPQVIRQSRCRAHRPAGADRQGDQGVLQRTPRHRRPAATTIWSTIARISIGFISQGLSGTSLIPVCPATNSPNGCARKSAVAMDEERTCASFISPRSPCC